MAFVIIIVIILLIYVVVVSMKENDRMLETNRLQTGEKMTVDGKKYMIVSIRQTEKQDEKLIVLRRQEKDKTFFRKFIVKENGSYTAVVQNRPIQEENHEITNPNLGRKVKEAYDETVQVHPVTFSHRVETIEEHEEPCYHDELIEPDGCMYEERGHEDTLCVNEIENCETESDENHFYHQLS
ncbi:MAG: hypothetical protein ACI35O_14505 [Bacillaceae bacterium]